MGTRRCFISVDCAPPIQDAIATFQEPLANVSGVRLVEPTQTHVTLKFLGDVPDRDIDDVGEQLEDAIHATDLTPFPVRYGGIGVFPSYDYISVIWTGVRDGGRPLEILQEAIETRYVASGFDPEDHDEFVPHVTIARMDHGGGKQTVQEFVRTEDPDLGTSTVREVRLKESILRSDGPAYETLLNVPLS